MFSVQADQSTVFAKLLNFSFRPRFKVLGGFLVGLLVVLLSIAVPLQAQTFF